MPTYDYAGRVETTMKSIEESDEIHPDNKEVVRDFKRDLKLNGKSDARIQKLTSHLKVIVEHLGSETRLVDLDTDGVKDLIEWVQGRDISEATQSDYKKVVKQFFKWLDGNDGDYPENVDWITTTQPNNNGTLPKDLLTREDIDGLKAACRNDRDRAFIALLYETGARIGEVIDLTIGDIEDHTHGRKVVIDGKTGQRRLPLLESTPAINKWLNSHPSGASSDPLWSQLRNPGKQLTYHYIRQKLLPRAAERAGIEKPMNPHHFRHSRATHLASDFKEAQLCEWFGWVQGSKTPGKYVHLSGRDIDNAYLEINGLREEEDQEQPAVKKCWRCSEINERSDKYCSGCGAAIEESEVMEVETEQAKAEGGIVEVESETEAKILQSVLSELRENPGNFLSD